MLPALFRAQPRVVVMVALVLSAGLAGGGAVAFVNAGDDPATKAISPILPNIAIPSPSVTSTPVPTPTPTPTQTQTPSPSPTASARVTATPTASPTAGTTKTYTYPKATTLYDGMALSATINHDRGTTATKFAITLKATDGDGTIYFDGIDWGDGSSLAGTGNPRKCGTYPTPTAQPGPYKPQSSTYERTSANAFTHTYSTAGDYKITVTVSSVNADCRPNGPEAETRVAVFPKVPVTQSPAPTPSGY